MAFVSCDGGVYGFLCSSIRIASNHTSELCFCLWEYAGIIEYHMSTIKDWMETDAAPTPILSYSEFNRRIIIVHL